MTTHPNPSLLNLDLSALSLIALSRKKTDQKSLDLNKIFQVDLSTNFRLVKATNNSSKFPNTSTAPNAIKDGKVSVTR
jgi:hypothetical protein